MVLVVKNICKKFEQTTLLKQVSFQVTSGKMLVLMGLCGAGKTTLLRIIAGLDDNFSGQVILGDLYLNNVPTEKRDIAMLFQQTALFPHLNVEENLKFALRKKMSVGEVKERADTVIDEFGLASLLHRYPHNLSGGESQRVAIARVFLRHPKLMLLDEPFSHLDSLSQYELGQKVKLVGQKLNIPVIYVTHSQKDALFADEVAVLLDGEILQQGTPEELYHNPHSKEIASFLGDLPVNFIQGKIEKGNFYADNDTFVSFPAEGKDRPVCACVRPQHAILSEEDGQICSVEDISFCGQGFIVTVKFQTIMIKVFSTLGTWKKDMQARIVFQSDKVRYL